MQKGIPVDYECLWQDEIADQWLTDFVICQDSFPEVSVQVIDPDGYVEPGSPEFDVKAVTFTISVNGDPFQLWVLYDSQDKEITECESWRYYDLDPDQIGKALFEINERWKLVKQSKSKDH